MSLQGVPQEHGYYGDCSVALERVGCWIHDNRQLNYNPTRIRSIKLRGGGGGGGRLKKWSHLLHHVTNTL